MKLVFNQCVHRLNIFQASCTKVHLIVLQKQLSTRDFLPCTKVFFRAGYEWLHGHLHFGCLLRKSGNFSVPSHGNINIIKGPTKRLNVTLFVNEIILRSMKMTFVITHW